MNFEPILAQFVRNHIKHLLHYHVYVPSVLDSKAHIDTIQHYYSMHLPYVLIHRCDHLLNKLSCPYASPLDQLHHL